MKNNAKTIDYYAAQIIKLDNNIHRGVQRQI